MPLPDQLFTPTNIASLGVATAAVNVVANALYKLAKWSPKWTAFVCSLAIAYLAVFMESAPQWYEWLLAFFNACLLFCSALGVNELGASAGSKPGQGFARGESFFTSWIRTS
jgi:hypothetical protein